MNIVSDTSHKWIHGALEYFPEAIQDQLVRKMIGSGPEQDDVLAQLQTANRLNDLGFSILEGNNKEGVFQAQYGHEDPFWVVSCSLSRFVTPMKPDLYYVVNSLARGRFQSAAEKSLAITIEESDVYTPCINEVWDIVWEHANKTLVGGDTAFAYRQFNILIRVCPPSESSKMVKSIVYPGLKEDLHFAMLNAVKNSLRKTSSDMPTMISMNVSPEPFASSMKDLGFPVFTEDQSRAVFRGEAKSRLSGILFSHGNPARESSLVWEFRQNKMLNNLTFIS